MIYYVVLRDKGFLKTTTKQKGERQMKINKIDSYDTIVTVIYLLKSENSRVEYHVPNSKGKGEVIYVSPYGNNAPLTAWTAEAAFGVGPDPDIEGELQITNAYGEPILTRVSDIELTNAYNGRKANLVK